MKKTIITLMALAGVACAAEVTWTGEGSDSRWGTAANWSTNSVPTDGDTIIINDGSSVTWDGTASGVKYNSNTSWSVTNGSSLTLSTKDPNSSNPSSNPRFDGSFYIDATSTVTTCATFLEGTSTILGTLYVGNLVDPSSSNAIINFGETGIIKYLDGSKNGIEGNNRTLTLGATLNTGIVAEGANYTVEKRYLIAGDSGNDFSITLYQTLTLAGGTMTSAASGEALVAAKSLTSSVEDFGKYVLGNDNGGVYVQYVKSDVLIPEPATATLSLLALAGLCARRRRG